MDNLTKLYCLVDDFCKNFDSTLKNHLVSGPNRKRKRATQFSLGEMVTIMILFQLLRYRQFKIFYQYHVLQLLHKEFPNAPSYSRMVELMPRCAMAALFHSLKGDCSGISIVDSTPLAVCDNLRIR